MTTAAPSTRPRLALWLGLGGLAAFAAIAVAMWATIDSPFSQPLDDWWRGLVGASSVDEVDGPLPMFFQYFGEGPGFLLWIIVIPIAFFAIRRWRTALFWLASMMGANMVVSQLVKNLLDRERPDEDVAAGLAGPLFSVDHGSFPSGHATTMGAFVIMVAALLPIAYRRWWWAVAALLSVGMIWQRTLINAHWMTDAFAGILGGAAWVALMWWAFAPWLAKDRGKPLLPRRKTTEPAPASAE